MKYVGLDAEAEVVDAKRRKRGKPEWDQADAPDLVKKFKGKKFKSYSVLAKALKANETVTVRVNSTGELGTLLGYGEVTGVDSRGQYSVPRILAHEY